ncbi:MAG: DUF2764 family protein [bacterium]|nr:DUF2764 family protein [bacterium]
MSTAYYYVLATLPHLRLGDPAPVGSDAVRALCRDWLPAADLRALAAAMDESDRSDEAGGPAAAWRAFDTALRNALVTVRAARRGLEAAPYLRAAAPVDEHTRALVQECVKLEDPLKAELALDQARWAFLDNLCVAHAFDFTVLLGYLLKLRLLERWQALNAEAGAAFLDVMLTGVSTA